MEKWPKYTGPNWYLQAAVRWSCANFDDWHWMHDCWLFEFCNRKASKCRSINSRTNHSIFRWFLPLHWLFLDLLCFVWHISFRFVSSFFVSFRCISFRFVILHFVSFRFVVFRFVVFRFVFVSQFSSTLPSLSKSRNTRLHDLPHTTSNQIYHTLPHTSCF